MACLAGTRGRVLNTLGSVALPVLPPDSRHETPALLRRWWPEGEPPAWTAPGPLDVARRVLAGAALEYATLIAELRSPG